MLPREIKEKIMEYNQNPRKILSKEQTEMYFSPYERVIFYLDGNDKMCVLLLRANGEQRVLREKDICIEERNLPRSASTYLGNGSIENRTET